MTDQELNSIEARASAATPGPWTGLSLGEREFMPEDIPGLVMQSLGPISAQYDWDDSTVYLSIPDNDASFIAHARQDIPRLVAEVKMLKTELKQLKTIGSLSLPDMRMFGDPLDKKE